jgi:SSS family solute:Na+ symporter
MQFASIMDYVQALFSMFVAPLFGTVLLGMLWKRVTRSAGFLGLLAGVLASIAAFLLMKFSPERWVPILALTPRASGLAQDMYQALWACVTCVVVTVLVTLVTKTDPTVNLAGLVYGETKIPSEAHLPMFQRPVFWGAVVIVVFVILNIIFW